MATGANIASVTLEHPLGKGEDKITEVTVAKPTAGPMRGLKLLDVVQMDVSALSVLLPRITTPSLSPEQIDRLDPADLMQIGARVSAFFTTDRDLKAAGAPPIN
ncbi:MAG: phage tail assembly protein [Rhodobacter sp.]|nr:phage tail assembly protein [Rhodobacter sp.]